MWDQSNCTLDTLERKEHIPKIVLIGPANAGKTTLLKKLEDKDCLQPQPSIGASYAKVDIDGLLVHIWDTAGEERYGTLMPNYTRGADLVLYCTTADDTPIIPDFIDPSKVTHVTTKNDISKKLSSSSQVRISQTLGTEEVPHISTSGKTGDGVHDLKMLIKGKCFGIKGELQIQYTSKTDKCC